MKVTGLGSFGVGLFSDEDPSMISEQGLESFLGHFPAGTSYRCINHFRQLMLSGEFRKYDFGIEENFERYKQTFPPSYDLSKIKDVPIAMLCGARDQLSSPEDYRWLRD